MTQATLKLYATLYLESRIQAVMGIIERAERQDTLEEFQRIHMALELELNELNKM